MYRFWGFSITKHRLTHIYNRIRYFVIVNSPKLFWISMNLWLYGIVHLLLYSLSEKFGVFLHKSCILWNKIVWRELLWLVSCGHKFVFFYYHYEIWWYSGADISAQSHDAYHTYKTILSRSIFLTSWSKTN